MRNIRAVCKKSVSFILVYQSQMSLVLEFARLAVFMHCLHKVVISRYLSIPWYLIMYEYSTTDSTYIFSIIRGTLLAVFASAVFAPAALALNAFPLTAFSLRVRVDSVGVRASSR